MRKWARPASGAVITVLLFVHGLPGFIDNSLTWHSWIERISFPPFVYPVGIVGSILFGTSEWWWPRVRAIVSRVAVITEGRLRSGNTRTSPDVVPSTSAQAKEDITRFRECLPHIQRCRRLIRPLASTPGQLAVAKQVLNARDTFAEIATEMEFLTRKLNELGIASPDIWGEEGNDSLEKVHFRLVIWSEHLARLEAKIHQDDLVGASS